VRGQKLPTKKIQDQVDCPTHWDQADKKVYLSLVIKD
jgi:hypothetical protein